MQQLTKPRPDQPNYMLTLKKLWRDSLSEADKDYWRALFISPKLNQTQIRQQLADRLDIHFTHNTQLKKFHDWELEQRRLDLEAERQHEDERRLIIEFGKNQTLDEIREEVLKRSYARALANGDFDAGCKTVAQDVKAKKARLDERKVMLLEQKAAQADAARQVTRSKMTPAEKDAEYKRIFGIA